MEISRVEKIILDINNPDIKVANKIELFMVLFNSMNDQELIVYASVRNTINCIMYESISQRLLRLKFSGYDYLSALVYIDNNNIIDEVDIDKYIVSCEEKHVIDTKKPFLYLDMLSYDLVALNNVLEDISINHIGEKIKYTAMPEVKYYKSGSFNFIGNVEDGSRCLISFTKMGNLFMVLVDIHGKPIRSNDHIDLTKYNRRNKIEELLESI